VRPEVSAAAVCPGMSVAPVWLSMSDVLVRLSMERRGLVLMLDPLGLAPEGSWPCLYTQNGFSKIPLMFSKRHLGLSRFTQCV